jgi:hypothetical protein
LTTEYGSDLRVGSPVLIHKSPVDLGLAPTPIAILRSWGLTWDRVPAALTRDRQSRTLRAMHHVVACTAALSQQRPARARST